MERRIDPHTRDRALRLVRRATLGGLGGALGLSGAFAAGAAHTFSAQPVAKRMSPVVPPIPVAAVPVQVAPPAPVVIDIVSHRPAQVSSAAQAYSPAQAYSRAPAPSSNGPRPPVQAPLAAPAFPPPPAPVCHSTPSRPC